MSITFDFGNEVIVLPKGAVEDNLQNASREELCVLLSAAAQPSLTARERAKALGISEREVTHALTFWRGAGAILSGRKNSADKAESESSGVEKAAAVPKRTPSPSSGALPRYSSDELASVVVRPEFHGLIEHCQQIMGKVFNASEAEKVVGICEYLAVSPDFVALLCSHLAEEGKVSLRALETKATELHDRGIGDYDSLNKYIELREKSRTLEGKVRKLFGIRSRSLTSAERKYIEAWAKTGFPFDMIEYAYELTVNATGDAPIKYTDAIIEKWSANGYKSLADARQAEEQFQKSKKPRTPRAAKKSAENENALSSFSTDDFFEAAMRRSYGDGGKAQSGGNSEESKEERQ